MPGEPTSATAHRAPDHRAQVFALTWIAYAAYYLGRKGFSVCKASLAQQHGLGAAALGTIDTGYLAAYAVAQFAAGAVGDRVGARRLVGGGLLGAAAACAAFGASSGATAFFLSFAVAGIFQATGWPGTVKAMAAAFGSRRRGLIMGLWSTCYQVGGLAATAAATALLAHGGWRAAFLVPAAAMATVGLWVLVGLPASSPVGAGAVEGEPPGPSRAALLRHPAVWRLGTAYFALKLIRYSLLFWLPYYLHTALGYSEAAAGYQSIAFEAGGVAGAVSIGWASDRWFANRRRQVAALVVAALAGALILYVRVAALSPAVNFAALALVGFCLFGPDTLVSGAAAQDLGGPRAAALAAGVINGMGSVGAVLQGWVTAGISQAWGWNTLLGTFVALAVAAALVLGVPGSRASRLART